MRVLMGFDGSEYSNAVFDDLKLAGLPRGAEIKIVTIADLLIGGPSAGEVAAPVIPSRRVAAALKKAENHAARVVREAEEIVSTGASRLRSEFPEWNVSSEVVAGTPEWALLDAAKDWDADLIVVGSEGRSALGRLFLGSVSKRAATDARTSVRVARRTERKRESAPPKIIIGIDGSAAAAEAVKQVGRRVWQEGTEVRLAVVHDQPSTAAIAARLPRSVGLIADVNMRARRAEAMLKWASGELKSIGLVVSISIQKGDPKRILLKQAAKWNADSIFVGTRDFKNPFERICLGSVSTPVVTKAHCSVEIVRPRDEQKH
ncbi:MAG TPA: universal stress protein [Pyrinomonadaceae bacterium]